MLTKGHMSVPPSLCLLPPDGSIGDKETVIFLIEYVVRCDHSGPPHLNELQENVHDIFTTSPYEAFLEVT